MDVLGTTSGRNRISNQAWRSASRTRSSCRLPPSDGFPLRSLLTATLLDLLDQEVWLRRPEPPPARRRSGTSRLSNAVAFSNAGTPTATGASRSSHRRFGYDPRLAFALRVEQAGQDGTVDARLSQATSTTSTSRCSKNCVQPTIGSGTSSARCVIESACNNRRSALRCSHPSFAPSCLLLHPDDDRRVRSSAYRAPSFRNRLQGLDR